MPVDPSNHTKTLTVKLYMNRAPRLNFIYRDEQNLFEGFKKKTQELGIPAETVFWMDDGGEPVRLDNATTMMGAASHLSPLRIYACDAGNEDETSCSSCDELVLGRQPWKRHGGRHRSRSHSRGRSRDRSRGRRSRSGDRSTSRDHSRGRHRPHPGSHCGAFSADYLSMNPRFGFWPPFPSYGSSSFGGRGAFGGRGGFGARGGHHARGF